MVSSFMQVLEFKACNRKTKASEWLYIPWCCLYVCFGLNWVNIPADWFYIYYLSPLKWLSCFCLWILLTVGYFSFLVFVIVMYSHKSRVRRRIPISFNSYMLSQIGGRKPKREKIKKEGKKSPILWKRSSVRIAITVTE